MGPNLNDEQKANLNLFLIRWDSTGFNPKIMTGIIEISGQLSVRAMRPVPHFNDFIRTLNDFVDSQEDQNFLKCGLQD